METAQTKGCWEMCTMFQFQSFPCSGAYVNGQNTRKKYIYIKIKTDNQTQAAVISVTAT